MRIIVTTCGRYGHIIPYFVSAFRRAWPDCPWPKIVIWGDDGSPGANWIPANWAVWATPDRGWAANLLRFLGASDEPFLLLLDDYILDAVDHKLIAHAADAIKHTPQMGMMRVHPVPGPERAWIDGAPFGPIRPASPYSVSLQAAIWRPAYVREIFRADENPWQTEIDGSARVAAMDAMRQLNWGLVGTMQSAIGYRELMKRGAEVPETRAWIKDNL